MISAVSDRLPPPFAANWLNPLLLSWPVDGAALRMLTPDGLELDCWEGRPYVSLVGLRFESVRILGLPSPLGGYDEVNLRFYVRRTGNPAESRPGVVFFRQLAQSRLTVLAARAIYGEPFERRAVAHDFATSHAQSSHAQSSDAQSSDAQSSDAQSSDAQPSDAQSSDAQSTDAQSSDAQSSDAQSSDAQSKQPTNRVEYYWTRRSKRQGFYAETVDAPTLPTRGSLEEFLTARFWGYNGKPGTRTRAYQLTRPDWTVSQASGWGVDCDFSDVCGGQFASVLAEPPVSALLATGSRATVGWPNELVR